MQRRGNPVASIEARRERVKQTETNKRNALIIGAYSVYRLDEYNFVVDSPNNRRYYGDIQSALTSVFRSLVGSGKLDVESILKRIELSEQKILGVIKNAGPL